MAGEKEGGDGGAQPPETESEGRGRRILTIVAAAAIALLLILLVAYAGGWIGGSGVPPKVSLLEFQAVVDGVSDCTAIFNYVLYNEGTTKAYVDIDYLDNGYVIAHDFYIVEAGQHKYVGYWIDHVDCVAEHNYAARIAAVS